MADKEAYYFSHDANARHDPKCSALINDFGIEGYGVYWMLIEILAEQKDYKLKKFAKLYDGLARQMIIDTNHLRSIIEAMLHDYELLLEDDKYIWSDSLLRRMEVKEQKRQQKVEAGRIGGIKSGITRKTKQNEASLEANEPKESKVKESKVKEIKSISPLPKIIEKEFGRPLSPLEVQQILIWAEYDTDIVLHAVKTAVVNGKFNLKYIDTILFNWEKQNLRTIKDIQAHEKAFIDKKNKPNKPQVIQSNNATDLNSLYYNQTETELSEEENPFRKEVG